MLSFFFKERGLSWLSPRGISIAPSSGTVGLLLSEVGDRFIIVTTVVACVIVVPHTPPWPGPARPVFSLPPTHPPRTWPIGVLPFCLFDVLTHQQIALVDLAYVHLGLNDPVTTLSYAGRVLATAASPVNR